MEEKDIGTEKEATEPTEGTAAVAEEAETTEPKGKAKKGKRALIFRLILPIFLTMGVLILVGIFTGRYFTSHYDSLFERVCSGDSGLVNFTIQPEDETIVTPPSGEWTYLSHNGKIVTVHFESGDSRDYVLLSEDAAQKTFTYRAEDTDDVFVWNYSEWDSYKEFAETDGWMNEHYGIATTVPPLMGGLAAGAALLYTFAFLGEKFKWADIVCIVFGAIFIFPMLIGIFSVLGGVEGMKALQKPSEKEAAENASAEEGAPMSEVAASEMPEANKDTVGAEAPLGDLSEESLPKRDIRRSEFVLDLYDTNVDERTWKEFKKTASQEELAVIAVGAKYRIAHGRIKNILYAVGIILSIALLWPTGFYSLIGYPVFAFLATKAIRYQDTYGQTYRKLDPENKAFVDRCYNNSVWLTILDGFVQFATFWLTIPYQAILLFIGTFAPNFVISKNGILVSLPQGYDVGGLAAVGAYYQSFNFIDEALANTKKSSAAAEEPSPTDEYYKREEFTYVDDHGYTQTVYTDRGGKDAYDAGGHRVGTVSGEGKDRKFTPYE